MFCLWRGVTDNLNLSHFTTGKGEETQHSASYNKLLISVNINWRSDVYKYEWTRM
jgi:hypothetical protein